MLRSTSTLTIALLAGLTVSAAAGFAQTKTDTANCGVETWSTDKMTYVTSPCSGEQGQTRAAAGTAKTPTTECGPEVWSTDKMTYVAPPCVAGITEENPGSTTK
jgi:hypothetical protein